MEGGERTPQNKRTCLPIVPWNGRDPFRAKITFYDLCAQAVLFLGSGHIRGPHDAEEGNNHAFVPSKRPPNSPNILCSPRQKVYNKFWQKQFCTIPGPKLGIVVGRKGLNHTLTSKPPSPLYNMMRLISLRHEAVQSIQCINCDASCYL